MLMTSATALPIVDQLVQALQFEITIEKEVRRNWLQ
jgi:hypothetical protein